MLLITYKHSEDQSGNNAGHHRQEDNNQQTDMLQYTHSTIHNIIVTRLPFHLLISAHVQTGPIHPSISVRAKLAVVSEKFDATAMPSCQSVRL